MISVRCGGKKVVHVASLAPVGTFDPAWDTHVEREEDEAEAARMAASVAGAWEVRCAPLADANAS